MGAFGVYIWWHPTRFQGPDPGPPGTITSPGSVVCLQRTFTYVFFVPIRASNPKLRIASIVCYSILALPVINVAVLTTMAVLAVNVIASCFAKYTFALPYRITWGVQTVVNIIIVINTERTIWRNKHLISGGESTWGFGQIIAVILIVAPAIESFSVVKEKLEWKWKRHVEYRFQPILREGRQTWAQLNHNERWAISDVVANLHDQHLDENARAAIIGAFTSATQFFHAARTAMQLQVEDATLHPRPQGFRTASDDTQAQEDPQMLETKSPPLQEAPVLDTRDPLLTNAKDHITQLWEQVSKVCELRLPHVHDAESFLTARANLRATKEALGAALCALEAY
jgi:hypothetical protein